MSHNTVSYKCQNCGSPLVVEPGQDRAVCQYCRSQNLITIGADGSITLSLVQKIDSIDSKAEQILANQNAVATQALQMQKLAASGQLLTAATNTYRYFLENEYKPAVEMMERERLAKQSEKPPKASILGCGGCAVVAVFVMGGCSLLLSFTALTGGDPGVGIGLLLFGIFCIAAGISHKKYYATGKLNRKDMNNLAKKMDALNKKKQDLEAEIDRIKNQMSAH